MLSEIYTCFTKASDTVGEQVVNAATDQVVDDPRYRIWRSPVSDAFWIASSSWWRLTATSKSGLTGFPSRMPSAIRTKSCATLKGGPAGTAGGTQR